jgi:hypothetical protein
MVTKEGLQRKGRRRTRPALHPQRHPSPVQKREDAVQARERSQAAALTHALPQMGEERCWRKRRRRMRHGCWWNLRWKKK